MLIDQLQSDYKNLVAHHYDLKTFKKGSVENTKAHDVCLKYLNRIIENKAILGFDSDSDKIMVKELAQFI